MKMGNTEVHAETRSSRRKSNLPPSALSAPPREKNPTDRQEPSATVKKTKCYSPSLLRSRSRCPPLPLFRSRPSQSHVRTSLQKHRRRPLERRRLHQRTRVASGEINGAKTDPSRQHRSAGPHQGTAMKENPKDGKNRNDLLPATAWHSHASHDSYSSYFFTQSRQTT